MAITRTRPAARSNPTTVKYNGRSYVAEYDSKGRLKTLRAPLKKYETHTIDKTQASYSPEVVEFDPKTGKVTKVKRYGIYQYRVSDRGTNKPTFKREVALRKSDSYNYNTGLQTTKQWRVVGTGRGSQAIQKARTQVKELNTGKKVADIDEKPLTDRQKSTAIKGATTAYATGQISGAELQRDVKRIRKSKKPAVGTSYLKYQREFDTYQDAKNQAFARNIAVQNYNMFISSSRGPNAAGISQTAKPGVSSSLRPGAVPFNSFTERGEALRRARTAPRAVASAEVDGQEAVLIQYPQIKPYDAGTPAFTPRNPYALLESDNLKPSFKVNAVAAGGYYLGKAGDVFADLNEEVAKVTTYKIMPKIQGSLKENRLKTELQLKRLDPVRYAQYKQEQFNREKGRKGLKGTLTITETQKDAIGSYVQGFYTQTREKPVTTAATAGIGWGFGKVTTATLKATASNPLAQKVIKGGLATVGGVYVGSVGYEAAKIPNIEDRAAFLGRESQKLVAFGVGAGLSQSSFRQGAKKVSDAALTKFYRFRSDKVLARNTFKYKGPKETGGFYTNIPELAKARIIKADPRLTFALSGKKVPITYGTAWAPTKSLSRGPNLRNEVVGELRPLGPLDKGIKPITGREVQTQLKYNSRYEPLELVPSVAKSELTSFRRIGELNIQPNLYGSRNPYIELPQTPKVKMPESFARDVITRGLINQWARTTTPGQQFGKINPQFLEPGRQAKVNENWARTSESTARWKETVSKGNFFDAIDKGIAPEGFAAFSKTQAKIKSEFLQGKRPNILGKGKKGQASLSSFGDTVLRPVDYSMAVFAKYKTRWRLKGAKKARKGTVEEVYYNQGRKAGPKIKTYLTPIKSPSSRFGFEMLILPKNVFAKTPGEDLSIVQSYNYGQGLNFRAKSQSKTRQSIIQMPRLDTAQRTKPSFGVPGLPTFGFKVPGFAGGGSAPPTPIFPGVPIVPGLPGGAEFSRGQKKKGKKIKRRVTATIYQQLFNIKATVFKQSKGRAEMTGLTFRGF